MITISTDKSLLDRKFIHAFLTESYWAKGRAPEEMNVLIDNSLNFGLYLNNQQIGYARVLTDTFQFAYIMDVFIDPAHRGNGYSKELMEFLLADEHLINVKLIRLATKDAHKLYEQFNFSSLEYPERMMERLNKI